MACGFVPIRINGRPRPRPAWSDRITTVDLPPAIAPARQRDGRLPPPAAEPAVDRRTWTALALAVVLAFFAASWVYWAPAHPGVDQNGYLVGGKLFARTGSTGFRPADEYAFVGRMWVRARDGRCFPKYPLGLSLVYAATLRLGGPGWGVPLCFAVNPVAMALALVATFLVVRRLADGRSFWGLLGLLGVATSPVCIGLTDNPNSHATALCCVAWGMASLLRWWQRGGWPCAIAAGLLTGAAVTVRYTEGLLLLPLAVVAVLNAGRRSWPQAVAALVAWAVPVGALALYNLHQMGTLTGYDPTNESTGFAWANVVDHWDTMLRELNTTGLFFTLPFAAVGAIAMWWRDWRTALLLSLWAGPNLALYVAYYWAPDTERTIGYLRFTLTAFPALAAAAMIGLGWFAAHRGPLATAAAGVVVAVGCCVGLYTGLGNVAAEAAANRSAAWAARAVAAACPPGSVVFGPDRLLDVLQLTADYRLYDTQQFDARYYRSLADVDPDAPAGLQPQRAQAMFALHGQESDSALLAHEAGLVERALEGGRRVFVLTPVVESVTGRGRTYTRSTVTRLAAGRFATRLAGGWAEESAESLRRRQQRQPTAKRRAATADHGEQLWEVVELRPLALSAAAKPRSRRA